jgi:hypothetical protein
MGSVLGDKMRKVRPSGPSLKGTRPKGKMISRTTTPYKSGYENG